eukprot:5593502-Pleurochrysis_carterae.AAC.1
MAVGTVQMHVGLDAEIANMYKHDCLVSVQAVQRRSMAVDDFAPTRPSKAFETANYFVLETVLKTPTSLSLCTDNCFTRWRLA